MRRSRLWDETTQVGALTVTSHWWPKSDPPPPKQDRSTGNSVLSTSTRYFIKGSSDTKM